MIRELGTLPENFCEVKESLPEPSWPERLRFHLQTFWISRIEGTLEYLARFPWVERICYKLAHHTGRGCILFWNDDYNKPYRFWYKDVPAGLRVLPTDVAGWNFKQCLAYPVSYTHLTLPTILLV